MDEEAVSEFLRILDDVNVDLSDLGLDFEDLEDLDVDDLNQILAHIEINDDDEDEED